MNSKGFKNFQKGFSGSNFGGSNPRALLPILGLAGLAYLLKDCIYYGTDKIILVDVGHYAIKFNKITGLSPQRYREGYNFKFPILEEQIIYNVQTREN